jgi:hypothetical protein
VGLIICALRDCVGKLLNNILMRLDFSVVEDSEFTFELLLVLEDLFTALNRFIEAMDARDLGCVGKPCLFKVHVALLLGLAHIQFYF